MAILRTTSNRDKFIAHNKLMIAMSEAKGYERKTCRADTRTPCFTLPDVIAAKDIEKNKKHIRFIQRISDRLADKFNEKGELIKKGFDPMLSDVFCHALGSDKTTRLERRQVFKVVIPALVKMADVLTGVLPRSSVSVLSKQCDITTFGDALYDKFGDRLRDEDGHVRDFAYPNEKAEKKPSVSRMSRFLDWLEQLGLITRTYLQDDHTGANLPMIIQLTDKFYRMCGEPAEKLLAARKKLIDWKKKNHNLLVPFAGKSTGEIIEAERARFIDELAGQRQEYRESKRLANRVKDLEPIELRAFARCRVNNRYDESVRALWGEQQYSYKVDQEINAIFNKVNHQRNAMLH